jgi:methionine synthase / methylenetetrahydrofolate reductase(NADPH)
MPEKKLSELIAERVIVFDGAMGTELYKRHQFINLCFDELSVTKPNIVREIHQANRDAGADVLTTNSFGANRYKLSGFVLADRVGEICAAAAGIAREVAGDGLYVAGSVGPLGRVIGPDDISFDEAVAAFTEAIEGLKKGGADLVIFETFTNRMEMTAAVRAAVSCGMDYIPSMSPTSNIISAADSIEDYLADFPGDIPAPVMIGFNCGTGPKDMLEKLEEFMARAKHPVLVQPNAGMPQVVNHRFIYMATPESLATYAEYFVGLGVRGIGGCCGTSHEHIRELANSVKKIHRAHVVIPETAVQGVVLKQPVAPEKKSRFAAKLARGEWVTSVEIVPPLGYDLAATIQKSAACRERGVDAINIPDGPRASSRLNPLVTALSIYRDAGIEPVLHVACRDQNVIGLQSTLLGCAAAGINNILIITGDPPKVGDYPFATAVFDIDSIGLVKIASRLNRGVDIGGKPVDPQTAFFIGVGADPTHLDQERELERFKLKREAGAEFAITQPVYDPDALLRFIDRAGGLGIPILAGIWPLASLANAMFLKNEVPGVTIPDAVMERMAAAKSKEEARGVGIQIAREALERIRKSVSGVQVSAPFGNVNTALEVLK